MINEVKYGLVDASGKLVVYDDTVEYIYSTDYIEYADLTNDIELIKRNLKYFTNEYKYGNLGKHPDLKSPLKPVKIEIKYELSELDTSLN